MSEVQSLKDQLETCEEQRKDLERQLAQANMAVTQLQGEGNSDLVSIHKRSPTHSFNIRKNIEIMKFTT